METAERRIILLGKAGSGKSSTGNTLLGCHAFEERRSLQSATRDCKFWKCSNNERNMSYIIVDTPGILNTEGNLAENLLEIQRSVEICPEPHAFLLVFNPYDSLDEKNVHTVDLLRVAFGEQVFNHCIVVFTHGNYFKTNEEFTHFWQTSNDVLIKLIERCGGRIIRIENEHTMFSLNDGVNRIYEYVEEVSDSGRNLYNCQITKTCKNVLQEFFSRNKGQTYMQQVSTMVDSIELKSERRIILVGKTGNGKSSTGNSLLQMKAFHHKMSPNAVTERCMMKSGINAWNNIIYKVVDTPGLLDTSKSVSKTALEIQNSLEICPDPHAFLIIFSATNRMTPDEKFTIDMLRIMFGEVIFNHAVVVFTVGGEFKGDEEFQQFWTENEQFVKLVKLCGNRVAKIENNKDSYSKSEGTDLILKMVEEMSDAGEQMYSYNELQTHREVIEEHAKTHHGTGNVHEEVSEIVQQIGKKLPWKTWKTMLYGGILIGGSAMGVAAGANTVAATGASMMDAIGASRVGAAVMNNGAAVGGAVLRTAWNVVTKVKFW